MAERALILRYLKVLLLSRMTLRIRPEPELLLHRRQRQRSYPNRGLMRRQLEMVRLPSVRRWTASQSLRPEQNYH
jgi:hypothetical protein